MMKKLILFWIGIISLSTLNGQELVKAPKVISVELAYRYMMSNDLVSNAGSNGYGFLVDYAWQLSGFNGKKHPVYLSVPLGYVVVPGNDTDPGMRMLHYGWAVRHMLGHGEKVKPFLGYGLLLNQVSIENREGQVFGHQTRFTFGTDFNTQKRVLPYLAVEYSMARHPQLDQEDSSWLRFLELKAGVRIQ